MKKSVAVFIIAVFVFTGSMAQQTLYVNASNLNFRSDSVLGDNVIRKLQPGDEVTLLEASNKWAKITYRGITGFVAIKYLSVIQPYQNTTSTSGGLVYICNSKRAYAYHKGHCHALKRCKATTSKVTVSQAKAKGYRACKICY